MWAGIFSFFINTLYLTFPIYMLVIYDRVLASFSVPTLIVVTLGAVIALITFGLLEWVKSRLLIWISADMDRKMGKTVFFKTLQDATDPTRKERLGNVRDVIILRDYFTAGPALVVFDLLWAPIFIGVIFMMHPLLGAVAICGALGIMVFGLVQEFLTRERYEAVRAVGEEANEFYQVCLYNAEVATAMGMGEALTETWLKRDRMAMRFQLRAAELSAMMTGCAKSWRTLLQVLIYGTGAYLTITHKSTAGIMIAASITMGRALAPIEQLMSTWKQTVEARGAHDRLQKIVEETEDLQRVKPLEVKGGLRVEQVSFALEGVSILKNVSFELKPGEVLGIVGPSGAGKSTLCRTILGIWQPTSGTVKLDGMDIGMIDREALGKWVGYLPQHVEIFPGTIAENIARMAKPDPKAVTEAAKMADIHELILSFPQGYDSKLGPGGVIMSGGQKQRLGLARALYGNPKFLVLDEPNSNLDEAGEKALGMTLMKLREKGVTIVLVSHRPWVLNFVDKMLLMRDGQVVMFGPRQAVVQKLVGQQHRQAAGGGVKT